MSKVNLDIGEIKCAWCCRIVPVRKNRNGKLYPSCPNCGQQPLNAAGGQEIILERATIFGAEESASKSVEPTPEPEHEQLIDDKPPETPRRSSGFDFLNA